MGKPADRRASPAELRFRAANSNDAARAVLLHHFVNVPHCAFAQDDGISQYLASETGIETFPAAADAQAPANIGVPAILGEATIQSISPPKRLLRGGFALSVFLHAITALAIGAMAVTFANDAPLEEGITSVTFVTEGTADADARAAGATQDVKAPDDNPLDKPAETLPEPVQPQEMPERAPVTTENILKNVPMPELGADLPTVLSTATEADVKVDAAAKALPATPLVEQRPEQQVTEAKPLPKPLEVVKPVETKTEEKPKPREKRRLNRGNQGDQANNAKKGDVDSDKKGKASTSSRGESVNREIGNAARSNYKGLVNKRLARARDRIRAPAKGSVTIAFTIMANGTVSGLRVTQSSGKEALDATALKVVRSAAPFPPIPAETGEKSWKMTVPMTFKGG